MLDVELDWVPVVCVTDSGPALGDVLGVREVAGVCVCFWIDGVME